LGARRVLVTVPSLAGLVGGGLVGATFPWAYRLLLAGWLGLLRAWLPQAGGGAVPTNPA
jgi:hypothetical protein